MMALHMWHGGEEEGRVPRVRVVAPGVNDLLDLYNVPDYSSTKPVHMLSTGYRQLEFCVCLFYLIILQYL